MYGHVAKYAYEKGSSVHRNHSSGIFPVHNEIATMFLRVLAHPTHTVAYNTVDYFVTL